MARTPPNQQTWENFKAHFLKAQDQLRLRQTAKQTGYYGTIIDKHLSDQCTKIEEATNQFLATAHQQESDISTISASQSTLSAQTEKFEKILTTITNRLESLEQASKRSSKGSRPPRKDHGSYCWTHGYLVTKNHTSKTCRQRKPGHQEEATRDNNMGGNQDGKPN